MIHAMRCYAIAFITIAFENIEKQNCNKLSAVVLFHITWLCVLCILTVEAKKSKKNILEMLMARARKFFLKVHTGCRWNMGMRSRSREKLSFKSKFMSYYVALRWKIHEECVHENCIEKYRDGDECVSCWFLFFKFELLLYIVMELWKRRRRRKRDLRVFLYNVVNLQRGENFFRAF